MKIFWDEPFDVEKCIVCLEPAVVFTGHLMLGPIAVGAGFCKKPQHNHRGDIIAARNGTTMACTYGWDAFGVLRSQIGTDVCRFKLSSKERDATTGFSYYGYRFYAPQWQRWISRDPIKELGGLNLYRYVGNSPINKADRLGLAVDLCCGKAVGKQLNTDKTKARFQGEGADAAWHCYVGCQIAKICNQETASAAGLLYEIGQIVRGNEGQAESRDVWNTHIGAVICAQTGSCEDCCREMWENGELF